MAEQDERITTAIAQEQGRLRNFIRKRVADESEVEDILQDVFYELVEAYRLMKPIEQVSAWMFRVARNRIIDLFRKKKPVASTSDLLAVAEERRAAAAGGLAAVAGGRARRGLCAQRPAG